jgi:hypothetical protein
MDSAELPDDLAGIVHAAAHRSQTCHHPWHRFPPGLLSNPGQTGLARSSCKDAKAIGKGQSWDRIVTGKGQGL